MVGLTFAVLKNRKLAETSIYLCQLEMRKMSTLPLLPKTLLTLKK